METSEKPNLKRRHFLLTAGAGSAAAAAAVATIVGGPASEAAPEIVEAADGKTQGYTATAHVRNYYRTTRI